MMVWEQRERTARSTPREVGPGGGDDDDDEIDGVEGHESQVHTQEGWACRSRPRNEEGLWRKNDL